MMTMTLSSGRRKVQLSVSYQWISLDCCGSQRQGTNDLAAKIHDDVAWDHIVAMVVAVDVAVAVGIVWGDHGYEWLMDQGYECESWVGEESVDAKRMCWDDWKLIQDWCHDLGLREEGATAPCSA
jgi:hypothetical protein